MSGPSLDIAGVGELKLADIVPVQPAELAAQKDLSRALEVAVSKAVSFPTGAANPAERPNAMMPEARPNSYVRDQSTASDKSNDPEFGQTMDKVTDRFRDLYVEVTNFSVVWSVAKRSGRDIETLLKGQ